MYFQNSGHRKTWLNKTSKKSTLRGPHHLYHIYWSMWRQLNWKKSLLVIGKFLWLFLNTLPVDDKYSHLNRDNLKQPIQMQLSQKQETFSKLVCAFLKSILNFEHFQRKVDPHNWCISEITDSKKRG